MGKQCFRLLSKEIGAVSREENAANKQIISFRRLGGAGSHRVIYNHEKKIHVPKTINQAIISRRQQKDARDHFKN